jgi:hypothetical protein
MAVWRHIRASALLAGKRERPAPRVEANDSPKLRFER